MTLAHTIKGILLVGTLSLPIMCPKEEPVYLVTTEYLTQFERGIYDTNENGKVDIGIDPLFFGEDVNNNGLANRVFLHKLLAYKNKEDGTIDFAFEIYPYAIYYDFSNDGLVDWYQPLKEKIIHDGVEKLLQTTHPDSINRYDNESLDTKL